MLLILAYFRSWSLGVSVLPTTPFRIPSLQDLFNCSEFAAKSHQLLNDHIYTVVKGKKTNRSVGFVLYIPVDSIFHEDNRVIASLKKAQ